MPVAPIILRREPIRGTNPAIEVSGRPPVALAPHGAPEKPRQGLTPSRWASRPMVFFFNPQRWQEDRFLGRIFFGSPVAAVPPGYQLAHYERTNIDVPLAGTYGDQHVFHG
jgi:hypothetical protein